MRIRARGQGSLGVGGGVDTTPDAFTFTDQTGVAVSSTITSAPITVQGINSPAPISVAGGQYSVDGAGATAAPGFVNVGQVVRAIVASSSSNSTAANVTVTIGGVSDTFTATTVASGSVPGQPSAPTGAAMSGTQIYWNVAPVAGADGYRWQTREAAGPGAWSTVSTTTSTSFQSSAHSVSTDYQCRALAYNGSGDGAYSNPSSNVQTTDGTAAFSKGEQHNMGQYWTGPESSLNWFVGCANGAGSFWKSTLNRLELPPDNTGLFRLKEDFPSRDFRYRKWRPGTLKLTWTGPDKASIGGPSWCTITKVAANHWTIVVPAEGSQTGTDGMQHLTVTFNSYGEGSTAIFNNFRCVYTDFESLLNAGEDFPPYYLAKFAPNITHIRPTSDAQTLGMTYYDNPSDHNEVHYLDQGAHLADLMGSQNSYGLRAKLAEKLECDLWPTISPGHTIQGYEEIADEIFDTGFSRNILLACTLEPWNFSAPYGLSRLKVLRTQCGGLDTVIPNADGSLVGSVAVQAGVNAVTLSGGTTATTGSEMWLGRTVFTDTNLETRVHNRTCFFRSIGANQYTLHSTYADAQSGANPITPHTTNAAVQCTAMYTAANAFLAEKLWQMYDVFVAKFGAGRVKPVLDCQTSWFDNLASIFAYRRGGVGPRFGSIWQQNITGYVGFADTQAMLDEGFDTFTDNQIDTLFRTGYAPDGSYYEGGMSYIQTLIDNYKAAKAANPFSTNPNIGMYEGWHHFSMYEVYLANAATITASSGATSATFSTTAPFTTGQAIATKNPNTWSMENAPFPGRSIYVRVINGTTASFHATPADAIANTGLVTLARSVTAEGVYNCTRYGNLMYRLFDWLNSASGIAWQNDWWAFVKANFPAEKSLMCYLATQNVPESMWGRYSPGAASHQADNATETMYKAWA